MSKFKVGDRVKLFDSKGKIIFGYILFEYKLLYSYNFQIREDGTGRIYFRDTDELTPYVDIFKIWSSC